jgi:hypothetical protein
LANYYENQPAAENKVASAAPSKTASKQNTTIPVKGAPAYLYQPKPGSLFQIHGNVAECVEHCWNRSYMGAPYMVFSQCSTVSDQSTII